MSNKLQPAFIESFYDFVRDRLRNVLTKLTGINESIETVPQLNTNIDFYVNTFLPNTLLIDDDGNYLTDENGNYLTIL